MREDDVEALASADSRARLSFWRLLRLYLDPFALFKNVNIGTPYAQTRALHYNQEHRGILITYARRWALIGLACMAALLKLSAMARGEPILLVPMLGLELGFTTAICAVLLSLAVYLVLGITERISSERPD